MVDDFESQPPAPDLQLLCGRRTESIGRHEKDPYSRPPDTFGHLGDGRGLADAVHTNDQVDNPTDGEVQFGSGSAKNGQDLLRQEILDPMRYRPPVPGGPVRARAEQFLRGPGTDVCLEQNGLEIGEELLVNLAPADQVVQRSEQVLFRALEALFETGQPVCFRSHRTIHSAGSTRPSPSAEAR